MKRVFLTVSIIFFVSTFFIGCTKETVDGHTEIYGEDIPAALAIDKDDTTTVGDKGEN